MGLISRARAKVEKNEIVKNTTSSAFSAAQAKWYQL
jgi:hypothetical protein